MINDYRDFIWDLMDSIGRPYGKNKLSDTGLKDVIKRPHNLVNIYDSVDSNRKIIAQCIDLVTTPFKKEDVKITIIDNILNVSCGSSNIKDDYLEEVVYRGISSQSYTFSLTLSPAVDQSKITAENKDGILRITIPLKNIKETIPNKIEINID